ncbi:MAG: HAMP domain-containing protein, partial [Mycobacteriaceae bacterium]
MSATSTSAAVGKSRIGTALSRSIDNRRMRTKVLIIALLGLLLAAVIGQVAIVQLASLDRDAQAIESLGLQPVTEINVVRRAFLQTRIDGLADEMQATAGPEHDAFLADISAMDQSLKNFETENQLSTSQSTLVADVRKNWQTYHSVVGGRLLALARAQSWSQYDDLRNTEVKPAAAALNDALTQLEDGMDAQAQSRVKAAKATADTAKLTIYSVLGLGLLLALLLSLWVAKRITGPIQRTAEALRGLADGDLVQHLDLDSNDEVGLMSRALNTATETLRKAMGALDANAQALASASEELSSVSGQMSGSAQESASQAELVSAAAEQVSRNVQTVATGTEEMSASIREIAQNATNAAGVAS